MKDSKGWCIFLLLIMIACQVNGQQMPFPRHTRYSANSILPDIYNQQQLDTQVMHFYNDWKAKYIKNGCAENESYVLFIDTVEEKNNHTMSTSESQAYGMLITAFMGGYDKDAKIVFDRLYQYKKNRPSNVVPVFMAWKQEGCEDKNEKDNNSATDADMDIAYALLLAHRQWGSAGKINYSKEAQSIIKNLYEHVVNQNTFHILLGDWVDEESNKYNGTRTSDFMCNHFEVFNKATKNTGWLKVNNACYTLLEKIQQDESPKTALFPDFIEDVNEHPTPAQSHYLESKHDGEFFYNACRVPFRIGLHALLNNNEKASKLMIGFNRFMINLTDKDPQRIETGYFLNGDALKKTELNSSAFVGGIAIAGMLDKQNQAWLNDTYNVLLLQQIQHHGYYDNTLKMLYLIVLSGNWWSPN
jgi:endo-1,4-beta-D-glucanase Y